MYLPRALRQSSQLDLEALDELELDEPEDTDGEADAEEFRQLLLDALAHDTAVQAAIRRLTGTARPAAEPRAARRR